MLRLATIRARDRSSWRHLTAVDLMSRDAIDEAISPDDEAVKVLSLLGGEDRMLAVVDGGELVGVVTRRICCVVSRYDRSFRVGTRTPTLRWTMSSEVDRLARVLWDYHHLGHEITAPDVILVQGSHDLRVAERGALSVPRGDGAASGFFGRTRESDPGRYGTSRKRGSSRESPAASEFPRNRF